MVRYSREEIPMGSFLPVHQSATDGSILSLDSPVQKREAGFGFVVSEASRLLRTRAGITVAPGCDL